MSARAGTSSIPSAFTDWNCSKRRRAEPFAQPIPSLASRIELGGGLSLHLVRR